jgi:cytidyltransferase-like protein
MNSLVKELIQPLLEETTKTVALFPGKFKPPHAGHLDVAKQLLEIANEVIIVISRKAKDGITAQQSKAVWDLYNNKLLDNKLKIEIADNFPSPLDYVFDYVKIHPEEKIIAVYGKKEGSRYKPFLDDPNSNVEIYDGGTFGNLNATDFRNALQTNQDISRFLPDGIDYQDFLKAVTSGTLEENCGCQHSQPTDFKNALVLLTKYMLDQGMNITPLPKLRIINNDVKNAKNILGRTAYYDPNDCSITLYTLNRHPKDILRSYAHEMIHRIQDNEGRLGNVNTTNTNEDGNLEELEEEAYRLGNITLRNWEDSIKNV